MCIEIFNLYCLLRNLNVVNKLVIYFEDEAKPSSKHVHGKLLENGHYPISDKDPDPLLSLFSPRPSAFSLI